MSVHVRVVHDLRYVLRCAINDSFNFPLGLIKYIVIVKVFHVFLMKKSTLPLELFYIFYFGIQKVQIAGECSE